jgi:hypothetical protein
MTSVKVAVRVRPFNQRPEEQSSSCIIEMVDNQTTIINPKTGERKEFAFDYSYWSHDGFEMVNGYATAVGDSKYADQDKVFQDLGQEVLDNAFDGYHTCLFAYG